MRQVGHVLKLHKMNLFKHGRFQLNVSFLAQHQERSTALIKGKLFLASSMEIINKTGSTPLTQH